MDQLYPPRDSKVYQVKEELEKLKLNVDFEFPSTKEDIRQLCNMKASDFHFMVDEIESVLADDKILNQTVIEDNEPDLQNLPAIFSSLNEEAKELHTIEILKDMNYRKDLFMKKNENKLRYKPILKMIPKTNNEDLKFHSEIVLNIRFYEPFFYHTGKRLMPPKFHQNFLVLGSQFLTDLRDKIYCQNNHGPFNDISENPFQGHDIDEIEVRKTADPGFFFIHETFYNDHRLENPDYSQVIIDWCEKKFESCKFESELMEETIFEDLKLRIGHPYVSIIKFIIQVTNNIFVIFN